MGVDGVYGRRRGKREGGEDPVSKRTRFGLGEENERADEGQDGRICLGRATCQR